MLGFLQSTPTQKQCKKMEDKLNMTHPTDRTPFDTRLLDTELERLPQISAGPPLWPVHRCLLGDHDRSCQPVETKRIYIWLLSQSQQNPSAVYSGSGFVPTSCSFWRSVSTGTYSTDGMIVEAAMATGKRCKLQDCKHICLLFTILLLKACSRRGISCFLHRLLVLNKEHGNHSSQCSGP